MNYFIITYGCQMNRSDSEKIAALLKQSGHKPAKNAASADLIAINFCSVRESAVHRALDQIYKLGKPASASPHLRCRSELRASAGEKKIIAAGCILPQDRKKLAAKNITVWHPDDYFSQNPLRETKFSAFVPIMTGCNNFCSYCAVPYTRGREKSRPAKEIVAEIKKLLKNGIKEIILLGQNVNSYQDTSSLRTAQSAVKQSRNITAVHEIASSPRQSGTPRNDNIIDFPALLKLINDLPGDFWLSFITSHPKDMSDKLIETMAKSKRIIPYLHLPVQSGDDNILRAMNRHYSVKHYRNLIKKARLAFKKHRPEFPPLSISTDIIAGFPGETNKQFQNTLKLIKDACFDMVYFARYSPRSGTAAAKLKDNISPKEKRSRAQAINTLLKKNALALNKKYIGQTVSVLIEKVDAKWAFGKTQTNKEVQLPCRVASETSSTRTRKKLKVGQIISAKITDAAAWHLKGI